MPRHDGLDRAFDLSSWAYFMDFALVPVAGAALLFWAWRVGLGWFGMAASGVAGVIVWTLAEYWIHRSVFHGATRFEPMHDMHHQLPKDMIGVASWGTFIGFAGVWLIAETFTGAAIGSAFAAGFMLGYLFYCTIHVSMHHHAASEFGRYGAFMLALHHGHHRGGTGNFGVSTPIWDMAFGTYRPSR